MWRYTGGAGARFLLCRNDHHRDLHLVAQALHGGAVDDVAHAPVAVAAQQDEVRPVLPDEGRELVRGLAEAEVVARIDPELLELPGVELQSLLVASRFAVAQVAAHDP